MVENIKLSDDEEAALQRAEDKRKPIVNKDDLSSLKDPKTQHLRDKARIKAKEEEKK